MDIRNMILLPVAALLAGGCGIYSSYSRDEARLPQMDSLYRDVPMSALDDSSSVAEFSWREIFTDSLLVKWIETGLENNTDLATAHLRTQEAQASLSASRWAFVPSLSLTPQGSIGKFSGPEVSETFSLGGTAEWEIDAFGSLRNAERGSREALAASLAYAQAVRTQLIATIAQNYYSLLALDSKKDIARQTQLQWSENVRVLEALKRAGQSNEAALAQARAEELDAESTVLSLERQIHELENSFSTLLGIVPCGIERGSLLELQLPEEFSVGVPAQLLSRRPDVRQAEAELAQAFYATGSARSAFYPQIRLSGSAGWTNSSGGVVVNPAAWLLNAVGSLVQPLLDGGRNAANLKIAKARQEEALLSFRQKLLDAGAEVNNALTQWQTARSMLELDRKKVVSLESAVRSTELLMEHGSTNYLEVLTARRTLLQAQLSEVSDRYDEIQGAISLYHALGGGAD